MVSEIGQGRSVVLNVHHFLEFKVSTRVCELILHPKFAILIFHDGKVGIFCAQQLDGRTRNTGRVDFENLVGVLEIGFPMQEFPGILTLQSHVDTQFRTHVVESVTFRVAITDQRPQLRLVVFIQIAHYDRRVGSMVARIGHRFSRVERHNSVDTTNRLCTRRKGKDTGQSKCEPQLDLKT